jgi:predicted transcriptional regulator
MSVDKEKLLTLTAQIVAAHVGHNSVAGGEIPSLINTIYNTLNNAGAAPTTTGSKPAPAVPIKQSVKPDYIVCLEDGKKLKMLKRYLATHYKMSPEAYRERWGLAADYPMVAPNYAHTRSKLAKDFGLGNAPKRKKST